MTRERVRREAFGILTLCVACLIAGTFYGKRLINAVGLSTAAAVREARLEGFYSALSCRADHGPGEDLRRCYEDKLEEYMEGDEERFNRAIRAFHDRRLEPLERQVYAR